MSGMNEDTIKSYINKDELKKKEYQSKRLLNG